MGCTPISSGGKRIARASTSALFGTGVPPLKPPFSFRPWHRLDNAATCSRSLQTCKTPNVFRLTAILTQPVDPALLQRAAAECYLFPRL